MASSSTPQTPSAPPPQDIYAEPKLLKKKRKKECATGGADVWRSSKSLSTTDIISKIVPVPIAGLDKNVASKIAGRHIAFHRSAQTVAERDARNAARKRSKPSKKGSTSAETRRARYVALESLIKHEQASYKYERFVPLHSLWLGYMQELLGLSLAIGQAGVEAGAGARAGSTRVDRDALAALPPAAAMQAKLLKADYHGALFTVKRAKNPALVGLNGIMIQESQETFKLITVENEVKVIPKMHCVFEFKLPLTSVGSSLKDEKEKQKDQPEEKKSLVFEIFGNLFAFRPAERVSRKFKLKGIVEL